MKKTQNKKGFSLVELMVGLVIGGIVILICAAIGTIAYNSYNTLRVNSGIYNDSQNALHLMSEAVRQSICTQGAQSCRLLPNNAVSIGGASPSNTLTIQTLNCTNINFAIQGTALNYIQNCTDQTTGSITNTNEPIMSGFSSLFLTICDSSNPFSCRNYGFGQNNVVGQNFQFILSGVKNGINFTYWASATRRNT